MYYLRLDEARELAQKGEADDDGILFEQMLNDGMTRFRFPFPWEDDTSPEELSAQNFRTKFQLLANDAQNLQHEKKAIASGHGFNIFIPCPNSQEFKELERNTNGQIRTNRNGENSSVYVNVVMEAIRDGKRKTVFQCPICEVMFTQPDEDVEAIKRENEEKFSLYSKDSEEKKHGKEIIKRIK